MSVAQVIATILGAGGVGGAVKIITTLTRLAVAVETAADKISAIIERQDKTDAQVADHENRLNRAGH